MVMQGNQEADVIKASIRKIFTFALIWGAGGNLVHDVHEAFDEFARGLLSNTCQLPPSGSVFDLFVDMSGALVDIRSWNDCIPSFTYDKTISFHSIMVPTLDTTRCDPALTPPHSAAHASNALCALHSIPALAEDGSQVSFIDSGQGRPRLDFQRVHFRMLLRAHGC